MKNLEDLLFFRVSSFIILRSSLLRGELIFLMCHLCLLIYLICNDHNILIYLICNDHNILIYLMCNDHNILIYFFFIFFF